MIKGLALKTQILLFLGITFLAFSSCQKDLSVENSGRGSAGSWAFQQGPTHYQGLLDSSYLQISTGVKILHLVGRSSSLTQNFLLNLYTADSFKVGTYKASLAEVSFLYSDRFRTLYEANGLAGEFTVTISTLSSGYITGQFSGAATDTSGTVVSIVNGGFTSFVDLSNNAAGVSNGTLGAVAGLCTSVSFAGTYTNGVPMNSTNTIQVQVNVTAPGTYTIATNTVNGVTFFGSGSFATTGTQTVTLTGSGTPLTAGTQTFTVSYGSTSCTFPLTFN